MLEHALESDDGILYLHPRAALAQQDFTQLAATVDPYIHEHGKLNGVLVEATSFPGWDSLGAMATHLRFIRDHHRQVQRIALVTDAPLATVAEKLGSHFIAAEMRHFPAGQRETARQWLLGR
ncbi:STAS/SEC14 domain-containing protein [Ramlibacter sp. G-1-2-2]|uniref:STAS/SEC14 domain-containing protein n=1 Tax=Ramlibacter agri TaxID=2728837 RepID=A0A848H1F0_9BURK|nr:STAS/SEC14 domain-containing protein [Ramlibacter agri]NML43452.1 STAS/SEC14 domain-containing protein [Ramlibacter agri]